MDDVAAAVKCNVVEVTTFGLVQLSNNSPSLQINAFTVPAGEGFTLSLATGTTVNMRKP